MFEISIQDSVIKGYHHFKIKPPDGVLLRIDLEYTNVHDENAALVWIPELRDIPQNMHSIVTDAARFLKLSDIAGLPIGHVPRGLAIAFRQIIEYGGSVSALSKGEPRQTFPPWPAPHETGGGAVIPCDYFIKTEAEKHVVLLKETLNNMPEKTAMTLSVSGAKQE